MKQFATLYDAAIALESIKQKRVTEAEIAEKAEKLAERIDISAIIKRIAAEIEVMTHDKA